MTRRTRPVTRTIAGTSYIVGYEQQPYTVEELAALPYDQYLLTPEWRDRRRQAIQAAGHHCARCGSYRDPLHVHHLTYERVGAEHPDDLLVLCADCHRDIHFRT